MVARTARTRPQAARSWVNSRPPIRSCATQRCRPMKITGPNSISWPGWIALRYLDDPATARAHFAHVDDGSANPIVLARANYWRGRAAEAAGENEEMRANYEAAARHSTAYYGQLARAKLGLDRIELRTPPQPTRADGPAVSDELRARRRHALCAWRARPRSESFVTDLAEQSVDVGSARRACRACRAPQRCARHAADRQDGARPRPGVGPLRLSRRSVCRSTARSVPQSTAASSIRSPAPKARSTSATCRRQTRSA